MPDQHAPLSASGSSIWLHCPRSYHLTKDLPDVDTVYSLEGTQAHSWCERYLNQWIHPDWFYPQDMCTDRTMDIAARFYVDTIKEIVEFERTRTGYDPIVMVEQRLDFSEWVPKGFGTGDCLVISVDRIFNIDFKYGKGVRVDAENNSQLRLYSLGAMNLVDLGEIKEVIPLIIQPRLDHISYERVSTEELLAWGEKVKPLAEKAYKGEGEAKAGEWCQFCKVNAVCIARAAAPLDAIKKILNLGGKK